MMKNTDIEQKEVYNLIFDNEVKIEDNKEEIIERYQQQIKVENYRLMNYIATTREKKEKKSFLRKIFNR